MRLVQVVASLVVVAFLQVQDPDWAAAQSKAAAITGRVVSMADGVPLPGVRISVVNLRKTVATDSVGRFAFEALRPGSYRIEASVIGYLPLSAVVTLNAGDSKDVEFRTDSAGQILPTVYVEGEPLPELMSVLSTFERRMAVGSGRFITREQILQRNPHRIIDMIRFLPGVRTECRGSNCRVLLTRGNQSCGPAIYVDDQATSITVLDNTPPNDIQGIEVYSGPAAVPPELNNETARCGGVIAIWTRRGRTP
jgi:hypothetical protein